MQAATLQQIDAKARKEFPDDYKESIGLQKLIFAMQTQVFHERASGMKLRVGYVQERTGRVWIWAIVTFGEGVIFYRNDKVFPLSALKFVKFDEPMLTLAGKCKDPKFRRLRSFIQFIFLEKGVIGRWIEGNGITFARFKLGCERIAAAKRNKFYGLETAKRVSEVDDEGYDSEIEELGKKSTKVKRTLSVEEQGDDKRVRRGNDSPQSALEEMQRSHDELRHEHQVLQGDHHNLLEEHRALQANHQLLLESQQALEREVKRHKGTLACIKVLLGGEESSVKED